MITGLSLENWKSHSSSSFSFGRGTNVLLGRMGSGKSSVLDALCFALYGTFPKMSRRDQSAESVVNIASGAENAAVRLSFGRQGEKYEIVRKIGRKASEAELRCGGRLLQKGARQVTDHVTGLLGVDYELFTRAIYSEQNRMDHLLTLAPRARKAEIDWLLGLGDFDAAREEAQAVAGKLSEQSSFLRAEADPKKAEEAANKAKEKREEEKKLAELCDALGRKKREVAEKHKAASVSLAALEKSRAAWRGRKSECDRLSGSVQGMEKEAGGKAKPAAGEAERLAAERKWLEGSLAGAKSDAKKLQSGLSEAKSSLAVLQKSLELAAASEKKKGELEKKMAALSEGTGGKQLEAELSALKEEAERLSMARAQLIAEAEELEKASHALHKAGAKCPVCDSQLPHGKAGELSAGKGEAAKERRKKAGEREKEAGKKKERMAGLEKTIAELRLCSAQLERLKADEIDAASLEAKVREGKEKAAGLEAKAREAETTIQKAEGKLEEARKNHEEALRAEKLFLGLEAARKKLAEAQAALAALSFDEEKYESARKGAEALSVELARAESDFLGEEKRRKLVSELRAVLEAELEGMERKAVLAQRYSDAAQEMAVYKNSLAAAQSELRSRLVEEINQALAEVWPAVYPYSDYEGVKLEADEKDYRLLMHKEGQWREVDSVASGGERACLCLSLRIAFATVLTPDIGWLILDEPTHNLDAEAVLLLAEAINRKIPSIVEQTFVITHDSALGESAEGAVFRLERDKSKGESTRVEKA
jgi:exonuclease SbcC